MKTLILQARETELFSYLLKYRVATIYQLMRDLPDAPARRHFSPRLKRLVELGYLMRDELDMKWVYSLGPIGQKLLFDRAIIPQRYRLSHIGNLITKTRHDVLLNDIYHAIEPIHKIQNINTHNQLIIEGLSGGKLLNIPDGVFQVPCNDKKVNVALELELSAKSRMRYRKVIYLYHKNRNIPVVLYITANQELKRSIHYCTREFSAKRSATDKIFVATVDKFMEDPDLCQFESSEGRALSFQGIMNRSTEEVLEALTKRNVDWAPTWAPCPTEGKTIFAS